MPSYPTTRARVAVLLAAALLAGGCSGGDGDTTAPLRQDLDTQARAHQALRERVDDLERDLEATGQAGESRTAQALASLDERIAALESSLGDLGNRLDEERAAREDSAAESMAALANLRGLLETVQEAVETLRSQLQELRDDHELLRAEFDRHTRDH